MAAQVTWRAQTEGTHDLRLEAADGQSLFLFFKLFSS